MIPAMLAALSVVREKELGSIINFYVSPVTRAEFLLGKGALDMIVDRRQQRQVIARSLAMLQRQSADAVA